jgi:hypothetical protein
MPSFGRFTASLGPSAARGGQQVALLHRGCEKLQFLGQILSQFCPCGSCPKKAGAYNIVVGLAGVLFACCCPPATEFNPENQLGDLIVLASTCKRALNPPHFWASKHLGFGALGALLGLATWIASSKERSRSTLRSTRRPSTNWSSAAVWLAAESMLDLGRVAHINRADLYPE